MDDPLEIVSLKTISRVLFLKVKVNAYHSHLYYLILPDGYKTKTIRDVDVAKYGKLAGRCDEEIVTIATTDYFEYSWNVAYFAIVSGSCVMRMVKRRFIPWACLFQFSFMEGKFNSYVEAFYLALSDEEFDKARQQIDLMKKWYTAYLRCIDGLDGSEAVAKMKENSPLLQQVGADCLVHVSDAESLREASLRCSFREVPGVYPQDGVLSFRLLGYALLLPLHGRHVRGEPFEGQRRSLLHTRRSSSSPESHRGVHAPRNGGSGRVANDRWGSDRLVGIHREGLVCVLLLL